jgi:hypothetical protein
MRFAMDGIVPADADALAEASATGELGLVMAALAGASTDAGTGATLGDTSAAWLSGTTGACAAVSL